MSGASETRLLGIKTPQGTGPFIPVRLSVTERVGEPYVIEVEVLGPDDAVKPADLLYKSITVDIALAKGDPARRQWHGDVVELQRLGPGEAGRYAYRIVAVPAIWRLGLRQNCRIFQNKTVEEILKLVLADHEQVPALRPTFGMGMPTSPIPYCTQFNETDLAFISRLLEEHGLSYYFVHTDTAAELHITGPAAGFPMADPGSVKMEHGTTDHDKLSAWSRSTRARAGAVVLQDLDWEKAKASEALSGQKPPVAHDDRTAGWQKSEIFRWPGGMAPRAGMNMAQVLAERIEAAADTYGAISFSPRFSAGQRVDVETLKADQTSVTVKSLITAVRHEASDYSKIVAGADATESYRAQLELVDTTRKWAPPARHPRPVMAGMYSARVVGQADQKVTVDEFGRIKVKFRWDRATETKDTTCWLRVMQPAAGAWGGTWFLPRVGDEVLVSFLDGDPDRPMVVGSVYGQTDKPPFLPGSNRTQSGYRTRSEGDQNKDNANILRFEDKPGSEELFVQAQKDLKTLVKNDETRTVERDQKLTVLGRQTEKITKDRLVEIAEGNDTLKVKQGNRTVEIEQGNDSLTVKQGNFTLDVKMGQISVTAMKGITLKVGGNSIEMTPQGITIKGTLVTVEAQGKLTTEGAMAEHKGKGMLSISAPLVKIN